MVAQVRVGHSRPAAQSCLPAEGADVVGSCSVIGAPAVLFL